METSLVLTIIGPDKPGIVDAVARALSEHQGNWLESRMARLAGQFAGILRLSVASTRADDLIQALQALQVAGLKVVVERSEAAEPVATSHVRVLELVGHDQPGIVGALSQVLARRGVNVEELVTECASAPMAGGTLFRAVAHLRLPDGVALDELREDLEAIANDLMVDLTLDPPEA